MQASWLAAFAILGAALAGVAPVGPNLAERDAAFEEALFHSIRLSSACDGKRTPERTLALALMGVEVTARDRWDHLIDFAAKRPSLADWISYSDRSIGPAQLVPATLLEEGLVPSNDLQKTATNLINDECYALDMTERLLTKFADKCTGTSATHLCKIQEFNGQISVNSQNMDYLALANELYETLRR